MGVSKWEFCADVDAFVDCQLEEVMFRWDAKSNKIFRKFYGMAEETLLVDHTNHLFNRVLRFGDVIDSETYVRGYVRR